MKLHHVAIVSVSQENADRFYSGILGLGKIKTSTLNKELSKQLFDLDEECRIILYGNEQFVIEVFLQGPLLERKVSCVHLCLEVKDRETFLEKCQGEGLTLRRIPKGDSVLVFIEDYDGNLFEIKQQVSG